jgi:putative membrane protein
MFWADRGVSGWGWFAMSLNMILFWALVIAAAVLLYRAFGRGEGHTRPSSPAPPSPEQVLAERFARGEIDEDEYKRRVATLRTSPPTTRHD